MVLVIAVLVDGEVTLRLPIEVTMFLCALERLGSDPGLLEEVGTQRNDPHIRAVTDTCNEC